MHKDKMMALLAMATVLSLPTVAHAAGVSAVDYVLKAGSGDLYETEASKLVIGTTKNSALKSFAETMVKDHTESSKKVKDAALADHVTLKPVVLDKEQRAAIQELAQAKGVERDNLYVKQQTAAHQAALTLHTDYSQSGTDPHLKATAGAIAPVVKHHIEMLGKLSH